MALQKNYRKRSEKMEEKGKDVSVTQEFKNVSVSFACLIKEEIFFFIHLFDIKPF